MRCQHALLASIHHQLTGQHAQHRLHAPASREATSFPAHLVGQAVGCVCPRGIYFLIAGQVQLSLVGKHEHSALHKGCG